MMEIKLSSDSLVSVLRNLGGKNTLFYFFLAACENEELGICQACLDAGASPDIQESFYKKTLFTNLIENNKLTIKMADWLISKGADINKPNIRPEYTPLAVACHQGNFKIAKYFLEKGAQILPCGNGATYSTLYHAVYGRKANIVRMLLDAGVPTEETEKHESVNPFVWAVEQKYYDIIQVFLEHGTSPNNYSDYGRTPLHIAVANGDTKTVRLLLENNADINAKLKGDCNFIKEYKGASNCMDIALAKKDDKMIELLSSFGGEASKRFKKVQTLMKLISNEDVASIVNMTIE